MALADHQNPDGTYDGPGALGELTGLSRSAITEIWAKVKANQKRLDACPGHDFAPLLDVAARKRTCKNCGGEADAVSVLWYEAGRRHAAGGS